MTEPSIPNPDRRMPVPGDKLLLTTDCWPQPLSPLQVGVIAVRPASAAGWSWLHICTYDEHGHVHSEYELYLWTAGLRWVEVEPEWRVPCDD